jgi:hypothetical protein
MSSSRYSYWILLKSELLGRILENYPNIKFNENPSSGRRVVSCGRTDGHRDVTKLIVPFYSFANAPKISHLKLHTEKIAVCSQIHT